MKYEPNLKIGLWTLLKYRPSSERKGFARIKSSWLCICTCGAQRWVQADNLRNGSSVSCGHRDPKNIHFKSLNVQPVNSVWNYR